MSHHIPIYIDAPISKIGYARITNEGVILSIWIHDQQMLFLPEKPIEKSKEEEE